MIGVYFKEFVFAKHFRFLLLKICIINKIILTLDM